MAEYRLAPTAERDMEQIWRTTVTAWGIDQADRYTDKLIATFDKLAETPDRAPACDHIRIGYRRRNVERHVIYFRKAANGIDIMRILHDRMDASRHL
ncbi:type II toxin-antitoxin system RelE/ParE family toxin [Asticcacaulis sp.]|uniref:type II toxin-antitoxin system RelE/ParE family toxin n=1 Tax=Asticcacaulis sp. TaxID=1872648 RepID=UPI003F7C98FA